MKIKFIDYEDFMESSCEPFSLQLRTILNAVESQSQALGGGENFLRSSHIYTPPPRKEQNYEIRIYY